MGRAAELARKHLPCYDKKVRPLRDELEDGILRSIPNTELNGHKTQRLTNTTNISFHGIQSEALLILLDKEGVCASSGSGPTGDSLTARSRTAARARHLRKGGDAAGPSLAYCSGNSI